MEGLPFELGQVVLQYNNNVFPTDKDVITEHYDCLVDYSIVNNLQGQLRALLEFKQTPIWPMSHLAVEHGQMECSSYPASGIARITHLWCVICGCCCNITVP